jgi:hypothetical protein
MFVPSLDDVFMLDSIVVYAGLLVTKVREAILCAAWPSAFEFDSKKKIEKCWLTH